VTFKCRAGAAPGGSGSPNTAIVSSAAYEGGQLVINGSNFQDGLEVYVGTTKGKKVKYKGLSTGSNTFTRLIVKGTCGATGALTIKQAGTTSAPYTLSQLCTQ
jgi:hypothetical protein